MINNTPPPNLKATPTLLPCPFQCVGGGTRTINFFAALDGSDSLSFVQCSCGAEGPHAYTEEGAMQAWNRRPVEQVGDEREIIDGLRMARVDLLGFNRKNMAAHVQRAITLLESSPAPDAVAVEAGVVAALTLAAMQCDKNARRGPSGKLISPGDEELSDAADVLRSLAARLGGKGDGK